MPPSEEPPAPYDREIPIGETQLGAAVFDHWDIDPETKIITHEPSGLSFKVYDKPETRHSARDLYARLVAGTPRSEDEFLLIADMGMRWFRVFGGARLAYRQGRDPSLG